MRVDSVRQRSDATVLIQVFASNHMTVLIIFPLPYAESLGQLNQLVISIQIPDLQGIAGIVIHIGDGGKTLRRHHAPHTAVQIIFLHLAVPAVIAVFHGGISALGRCDLVVAVIDGGNTVAGGIVGMSGPVIAVRQDSGHVLLGIPGFLQGVAVGVPLVGHDAVPIGLQNIVVVLSVISGADQEALGIEILQHPGIAAAGHHQTAAFIQELLGQKMTRFVICTDPLGKAGRGDHRLVFRVIIGLGQHVAQMIVSIIAGSVVVAQHEWIAVLVKIPLAEQAVFQVIFTPHFGCSGGHAGNISILAVINLVNQIAAHVIFADKGGVTVDVAG